MFRRERKLLAYALLGSVLLILLKTGCVTIEPAVDSDDPEVISHHNWWNYYERGAWRLRQGKIEAAKTDFEIALGLRPGAKFGFPKDMWRARTYGLHFIEGYFPNRELGVCLYKLGEADEATKYLETSLSQTPSGRAKHYTNLAREQLLAATMPADPQVEFDAKSRVVLTRERQRSISGFVAGKGLVAAISINGDPQFIELAEERIGFKKSIALSSGRNVISVKATDLLKQSVTEQVVWWADWQPPEFVITKFEQDGRDWVLEGLCYDAVGLSSVTGMGANRFQRERGRIQREYEINMRFAPEADPVLVAEDLAGNRSQIRLMTELLSAQLHGARPVVELAWLADAAGGVATDARFPLFELAQATGRSRRTMSEPSLRFKCAMTPIDVFEEEFFLDGTASGDAGLASISINSKEILSERKRGAVHSYFARRLSLRPGTNVFNVAAQDMKGNKNAQKITLIRRQPEYLKEEYRLSVGVPPLIAGEAEQLSQRVKRLIEEELISEPVRFLLMERDQGWHAILRELGLSLSDLSDPRAALRIRKKLPADMLLMASLMRDGDGLTVYAKVVETENGEVIVADDVYSEALAQDLAYQVGGLMMKIGQQFPLVSGMITRKSGNEVTIDIGTTSGVRISTRFVVIKKSPKEDSVKAGSVCKVGQNIVELNVHRAWEHEASGLIVPLAAREVVEGDEYVYAR